MKRSVALVALFAVLLLPACMALRDAPRPIVVQGAMDVEIQKLAGLLEHPVKEEIGGWTFWRGTIDGYPVIVSKTLKGMSNAAAATAIAVERFHPAAIINQGTAGGHEASLHLYDIVVGTSAVNLGAFKSPFRAAGTGSNSLDWRAIDLTASDGSASTQKDHRLATFAADAGLLAAARQAIPAYKRGHIVEGVIGSSDVWNDEIDRIAFMHQSFRTAVEEMETASAAQVAQQMQVPFVGIRVVSDNITNGDPYDPKTSEACEDYVFEVVKAYIARSRVQ